MTELARSPRSFDKAAGEDVPVTPDVEWHLIELSCQALELLSSLAKIWRREEREMLAIAVHRDKSRSVHHAEIPKAPVVVSTEGQDGPDEVADPRDPQSGDDLNTNGRIIGAHRLNLRLT